MLSGTKRRGDTQATAYNKEEARKLAGLIAKTSQQTVDENFMCGQAYQHRQDSPCVASGLPAQTSYRKYSMGQAEA